ncbi:hypothetical protein CTI14_66745, partial [Methylobacterium radiotolerans]
RASPPWRAAGRPICRPAGCCAPRDSPWSGWRRAGLDAAPDLEIAAALDGLEARIAALASRWEANLQTGGLLRAAGLAVERLEAS